MYIRDLLASLQRRWYILLVGLALTLGLCMFATRSIPAQYDADGSILLLPPASSVGVHGNPYLYLGGLGPAVDILVARLNSDAVQSQIAKSYPAATIVIERDVSTTGPVLLVTASSARGTESLAAAQGTLDLVPSVLARLQRDFSVPPASLITSMQLTTVDSPSINDKGRKRGVLALAGVGFVGTILLVGFLDGLLLSRRMRKDYSGPAAPSPADDGPPEASSSEPRPSAEKPPGPAISSHRVRAGR